LLLFLGDRQLLLLTHLRRDLILLVLRRHVLGDQLGLEAAQRIGVGEDGLGVVLRLVARPAGVSRDDEGALAGCRPID